MAAKQVWTFVKSTKVVFNDGHNPEYPPNEYPILIWGFLDHDPERKICMPVGIPENEQIAAQLTELGAQWIAQKAEEDARANNVVHLHTTPIDNGG